MQRPSKETLEGQEQSSERVQHRWQKSSKPQGCFQNLDRHTLTVPAAPTQGHLDQGHPVPGTGQFLLWELCVDFVTADPGEGTCLKEGGAFSWGQETSRRLGSVWSMVGHPCSAVWMLRGLSASLPALPLSSIP